LNGNVNKVNGVLPIVYSAREQGFKKCVVPRENAKEGAVVSGIQTYGVSSLLEAVKLLSGTSDQVPEYVDVQQLFAREGKEELIDFSEVAGQRAAKRAIEIAVTGMHNILMIGPPRLGQDDAGEANPFDYA
jgi:magnesium chelatase family protein